MSQDYALSVITQNIFLSSTQEWKHLMWSAMEFTHKKCLKCFKRLSTIGWFRSWTFQYLMYSSFNSKDSWMKVFIIVQLFFLSISISDLQLFQWTVFEAWKKCNLRGYQRNKSKKYEIRPFRIFTVDLGMKCGYLCHKTMVTIFQSNEMKSTHIFMTVLPWLSIIQNVSNKQQSIKHNL